MVYNNCGLFKLPRNRASQQFQQPDICVQDRSCLLAAQGRRAACEARQCHTRSVTSTRAERVTCSSDGVRLAGGSESVTLFAFRKKLNQNPILIKEEDLSQVSIIDSLLRLEVRSSNLLVMTITAE